jgi:hypothetical protein
VTDRTVTVEANFTGYPDAATNGIVAIVAIAQ